MQTAEPTIAPTKILSTAPTFSPTSTGVGASSISSASTSQTGTSTVAVGVGIGCVFLVIIMMCAFIFFRNKKEKQTPYQIWSAHYSARAKEEETVNSRQNMNEDIHHFYNKTPRPSINQHTTFTPHLSTKTAYRNSQLGGQLGSQRNSQRDSIPIGSLALHGRGGKVNFPL